MGTSEVNCIIFNVALIKYKLNCKEVIAYNSGYLIGLVRKTNDLQFILALNDYSELQLLLTFIQVWLMILSK